MVAEWTAWLTELVPGGEANLDTFLAFGLSAAVIFGLGKVGFGSGIAILAVPMTIYACGGDTTFATGLLLPLLIAADFAGMGLWWRTWNFRAVLDLLPGAAAGIVLGDLLLGWFQRLGFDETGDAALQLGIGIIALAFVLLQVLRKILNRPLRFRPVMWQASLAGLAVGVASTLAHAAGPVASMYLLSLEMPKRRFVASTVLLFWCVNLMKLPIYIGRGMINPVSLQLGLLLVPAIAVGALLGRWLNRRFGQRSFTALIYTLLAISGGHLIYKALRDLL